MPPWTYQYYLAMLAALYGLAPRAVFLYLPPPFPPVSMGKVPRSMRMSYIPISISRDALTIMDVPFPSLEAWESAAAAIGSNMFEGYEPTKRGIEIIRDYTTGKLSFNEFIRTAVDKGYAE